MSENTKPTATPAPAPGGPGRGPGSGGPMMGPGGHGLMTAGAKTKDFRGSLKRLGGYLKPHTTTLIVVLLLTVASVACTVAGPRILGTATNALFEGVIGTALAEQLPEGATTQQAIDMLHVGADQLRAAGDETKAEQAEQLADMLSGMDIVVGQGVDFDLVAKWLALLIGVYLLSAVFGWAQGYLMAGVTQKTIYGLRKEVDEKLARLPLSYFDDNARGDTLSRVTNDIDNIAQTLQQQAAQIVTSVLTIIGVLGMMFWISPLLALISLLVIPASVVVTMFIAKRSQKQFAAQWERTGRLNGHVEEMYTGHVIVKAYNGEKASQKEFDSINDELFDSAFKSLFLSGMMMPLMGFIGNFGYVAVCIVGAVQVLNGAITIGVIVAFMLYVRLFTQQMIDDFARQADPAFGFEIGDDVGDNLPVVHVHFGRGPVIGLEVGHDPRGFQRLAVHLPRRRAVGQRDHAVVRIGRVVQEHRQAGDPGQQDAGRDDHEIRFAKRQEARVVQRAERHAGGRLGHRHDRAHAVIDRNRLAVRFLHDPPEDFLQQERVFDERLVRLQRGLRQLQIRRRLAACDRRLVPALFHGPPGGAKLVRWPGRDDFCPPGKKTAKILHQQFTVIVDRYDL